MQLYLNIIIKQIAVILPSPHLVSLWGMFPDLHCSSYVCVGERMVMKTFSRSLQLHKSILGKSYVVIVGIYSSYKCIKLACMDLLSIWSVWVNLFFTMNSVDIVVLLCTILHVAYAQPGPPTNFSVEFMEDTRSGFLLHAVFFFSWTPPSGQLHMHGL